MCLTPCQCQKRVPLRELAASPPNSTQRLEPRRLSYQSDSSHPVKEKWTPAKTSVLIEFILFHTTGDTHKQMVFRNNAGEYVQTRSAASGDPFLDSRMQNTQLIKNKSSSAYIVSFLLCIISKRIKNGNKSAPLWHVRIGIARYLHENLDSENFYTVH